MNTFLACDLDNWNSSAETSLFWWCLAASNVVIKAMNKSACCFPYVKSLGELKCGYIWSKCKKGPFNFELPSVAWGTE